MQMFTNTHTSSQNVFQKNARLISIYWSATKHNIGWNDNAGTDLLSL